MGSVCLQLERLPKKRVAEEYEEFDYSDFYDDLSVSMVTAGPNVTEYEVRRRNIEASLVSDVITCAIFVSCADCGV